MTTSAAENLTGQVVEKKKDEKRRALGRGLESLLPGPRVVPSRDARVSSTDLGANREVPPGMPDPSTGSGAGTGAAAFPVSAEPPVAVPEPVPAEITATSAHASQQRILNLPLEAIEKNPYQTRYVFDEVQLIELRDSIKEHGVVQPVVVRPGSEPGRYILVLGERRLRASKLAGKESIPALVRTLSPQQAAEMTLLENVVRQDLNPIEQAEAFRVLSQEFKLTQAQIAERIGVSRETVANYMRLLRLPQEVMQYMVQGKLSFSDAREILSLEHPEHIRQLADEVIAKHLKVDQIKQRVQQLNGFTGQWTEGTEQQVSRGARWVDPNVRAAQAEMERTLGMRVRIKDHNGKGKIVIEYASVDDYERVVEMLKAK